MGRDGFADDLRLQVRRRKLCGRKAAKGASSGRSFAAAAHRLPSLRETNIKEY